MNFCKKTIILGGSISGILNLDLSENGGTGRLKTRTRDENVFLAIVDSENVVIVSPEHFAEFSLPALDETNLNVYMIEGDKILAHGKTAALRPHDAYVLDIIRRHREKDSSQKKTNSEISSSSVSDTTICEPKEGKSTPGSRNIKDFIFDISHSELYNDDAIAEVNYYEKADISELSPTIIPNNELNKNDFFRAYRDLSSPNEIKIKLNRRAASEKETSSLREIASTQTHDTENEHAGLCKKFRFSEGDKAIFPSDYERSFLSGSFTVSPIIRNSFAESKEKKTETTSPSPKKETSQSDGKNLGTKSDEKTIKALSNDEKTSEEKIATSINADFFEEVSSQINTLMKEYPHHEVLEKLIPDSKWIKINMKDDDHYVIGTISDLYIIYGVPGKFDSPPAELTGSSWLRVSDDGDGYWVLFQDASTGKSISVEFY